VQGSNHSPQPEREVKRGPQGRPATYPGLVNPAFHTWTPLGLRALVPEVAGDDAGDHVVELGDGGTDGECQALLPLLVPQVPDGAQTVVGHHFLEQVLGRGLRVTWTRVTWPSRRPQAQAQAGAQR
jgi:hypothetical protein